MDSSEEYERVINSFDKMLLSDKLLKGIYDFGFVFPSEFQKRAIVPFIKTKNIIFLDECGTGKTSTIAIGILYHINENNSNCQALILVSTMDLAKKTQKV